MASLPGLLSGSWLALLARLVLAFVFLMAGLTKLPERRNFVANVRKYGILPPPLSTGYALALPWLELGAALALLVGFYAWIAALVACSLLLTFMVAVSFAIKGHLNLDCSCFGLLYNERIDLDLLMRDGVLLLLGLYVVAFDPGRFDFYRSSISDLFEPPNVTALLLAALTLIGSVAISWRAIQANRNRYAIAAAASL